MKLFRVQVLIFSVFIFAAWAVMQQPSAPGGQGAQASPEQPSVTPQKGQTAEEQKKDMSECYDIAKAKTGIDPSTLLGMSKKVPGVGEAGSATQAGAAAAAGAAGAATGANQPAAAPQPESGQAQSSASKAKLDKFEIANQACLKARGYLVKGQAPATAPAAEQPK
jgi:hypothetical protein